VPVDVRLVVTGRAADDGTIDEPVAHEVRVAVPLDAGTRLVELWRVLGAGLPGDARTSTGFVPGEPQGIVHDPGGLAWRIFVLGPGDRPLHRTPTLDLLQVLDGAIAVTLETGEATLSAGDALVLRGDVHGWRNDADTPAILMAVMFGADDHAAPRGAVAAGSGQGPRRVVTGVDSQRRSFAEVDGAAPSRWSIADGVTVDELWQSAGPLAHPAQGADVGTAGFDWRPVGDGIAWRRVALAPGAAVSLDGARLDLVLLPDGEVGVEVANRSSRTLTGRSALVRRGVHVTVRNDGARPADLSIVSVCANVNQG
jgi:quercetin dioxygenase-like cupin family protein